MTQNPRVIRGYAGALTTALNPPNDGAMVPVDIGTLQAVRQILLDLARDMERKVEPTPGPRLTRNLLAGLGAEKLRIVFWNEDSLYVRDLAKGLDPYLAVDETDALEHVVKKLKTSLPNRATVSVQPTDIPEWSTVVFKGQVLAQVVLLRALPHEVIR